MLTNRPSPSYILPIFFVILFATGSAIQLLAGRAAWIRGSLLLQPVLAIGLIVGLQSYFTPTYATPFTGVGRALLVDYGRLSAFRDELTQIDPENQLLVPRFGRELCTYEIGAPCAAQDYGLLSRRPADSSVAEWLTDNHVGLFYVNATMLADPAVQQLLVDADDVGWQVLVDVTDDRGGWALVKRAP
jgi:hypothetical protein